MNDKESGYLKEWEERLSHDNESMTIHEKLINGVRDEPYNPSINRGKEAEIKLWAKFINHQLAAWAVIFELITGNKPPKLKEILATISGH